MGGREKVGRKEEEEEEEEEEEGVGWKEVPRGRLHTDFTKEEGRKGHVKILPLFPTNKKEKRKVRYVGEIAGNGRAHFHFQERKGTSCTL